MTNILHGFGTAGAALVTNVSRQGLIYIPVLFYYAEIDWYGRTCMGAANSRCVVFNLGNNNISDYFKKDI